EEVYVPGSGAPVNVPRGSEALFMLQRIRDEAHRFANTFHRELRGKRMTTSSLDGIPGLGESRKKRLTQAMGGVNAVKRASLDDLRALSFLPDAVADAVYERFHTAPAAVRVAAPRAEDVVSGATRTQDGCRPPSLVSRLAAPGPSSAARHER